MSPYNEVRVRFLKLHCLESVIPQEHVLQLPAHSGISFPLVISHRQPHNSESSLSPSGVFLIFQYHCNQGVVHMSTLRHPSDSLCCLFSSFASKF